MAAKMRINKQLYDRDFYTLRDQRTRHAAEVIFDILMMYNVKVDSIADLGGGVGTFLSVAKQKYNLDDRNIFLLEREYVKDYIVVEPVSYIPTDLENKITLNRKVDVAMSLEVAEHLTPTRAESYIDDLCGLSDCIIFSAAAYRQGGTNHINEQRLSYWIEKFDTRGYMPVDIFRPRIQYDGKIAFWYRQNVILYLRKGTDIANSIINTSEWLPPLDMISYDMAKHRFDVYDRYHNSFPYRKIIFPIKKMLKGNKKG